MKIAVLMSGSLSSTLAFFWARKQLVKMSPNVTLSDIIAIHYHLKENESNTLGVKDLCDELGHKCLTMPLDSYWWKKQPHDNLTQSRSVKINVRRNKPMFDGKSTWACVSGCEDEGSTDSMDCCCGTGSDKMSKRSGLNACHSSDILRLFPLSCDPCDGARDGGAFEMSECT